MLIKTRYVSQKSTLPMDCIFQNLVGHLDQATMKQPNIVLLYFTQLNCLLFKDSGYLQTLLVQSMCQTFSSQCVKHFPVNVSKIVQTTCQKLSSQQVKNCPVNVSKSVQSMCQKVSSQCVKNCPVNVSKLSSQCVKKCLVNVSKCPVSVSTSVQ